MTMIKSWKHKYVELNKEEKCEWKKIRHLVLKGTILDGEVKPSLEYMTWSNTGPITYFGDTQFVNDPHHCDFTFTRHVLSITPEET